MGGKGFPFTQEEYEEKVASVCDTVEVRGKYKGYYVPILHYKMCDKEFKEMPDRVIRYEKYHGCPYCKDRVLKEKKDVEYKKKLKEKFNGNVVCDGVYSWHNVPIKHHCVKCETEWEICPTFMMARYDTGCAVCTRKKLGDSVRILGGYEYQRKARQEKEKEYREKLRKLTDGNIIISKRDEFRNVYIDLLHYCKKHKKRFPYRPINLVERSVHVLMCPDCIEESKEPALKASSVRRKIKEKFGGKIKVKVLNKADLQSVFECSICANVWETKYANLLASVVGCPQCGRLQATSKRSYNNEKYLKQLRNINESYSIHDDYVSETVPIIHYCDIHNIEWMAKPTRVKNKQCLCPECMKTTKSSSRLADEWLAERAEKDGVKIRTHKSKKGEYSIKLPDGSTARVDGFCKKTNTVYEFYGDVYHGNPLIFDPDDQCHPHTEETAYSLLRRTLKRESQIRLCGYNVVSIWESDYLRGIV